MKILVCSLYINDWYRKITKYARKTIDLYCKKYNYDFYYETESTIDSVYDGSRDCPWFKIKLLSKVLEKYKDYDLYVWIDADCLIFNDTISLENLAKNHMGDKQMLLATDNETNVVNTGVIFLRNTEFCKKMLEKIWNTIPSDPNFHEQSAFGDLYNENYINVQDNIIIIPYTSQNTLFSYWSMVTTDSFMYHIARCSHDKEGFLFSIDLYCPIKMDEETEENFIKRKNILSDNIEIKKIQDRYLNNGTRLPEHASPRAGTI